MMNLGRACIFTAAIALSLILSNRIFSAQGNFETTNPRPMRPQPGPQPVEHGSRARDLIGKRVESIRGEKLGLITDMVIDTRSGRLDYVIISSGGFGGI